jgi:G3E family GTPase
VHVNPISTHPGPRPGKPRYIMVGGFLGAGKTTAVGALARHLSAQGLRVGLITNDQGRNLVDTAMLKSQGFSTEEIPGGCFCCRFDSLVDAALRLKSQVHPDGYIAEPVGSCTDLVATVTFPLRRLYEDSFAVAPVSVLVDPIRARRVFGLEAGSGFTEKVLYIYLKQLEEADLIVISKCDLLDAAAIESLRLAIAAKYPGKEILSVSARTGKNLDAWFERICGREQTSREAMEVDYTVYADGEALLGWLNCTVRLTSGTAFAGDPFLLELAEEVRDSLRVAGAEVAHLKMTLAPEGDSGSLGVVNLVQSEASPEMSRRLAQSVTAGRLLINLRAEAAPEVLAAAVRGALDVSVARRPSLTATVEHFEHFRPGKPTPTHRYAEGMV